MLKDILDIAVNSSPTIALCLGTLGVSLAICKHDVGSVKERLDKYDSMEIQASIARIEADISWIRAKLEKRI